MPSKVADATSLIDHPAISGVIEGALAYLPTVVALIILFFTVKFITTAITSRFYMAKPNEWMLLLRNGNCQAAGIGMSAWCPPGAQVVTFPSTMQETQFTASQATTQRAGVKVIGKAYWSIYRPSEDDPDGPFRAFKSLAGLETGNFSTGNEKVQTLAISTIRDAVSKMSIVEVMTSRQDLKERVKNACVPIFRGWGMWLETVEILDVQVESQKLFDDMQYLKPNELSFDTRADAHFLAETAKAQAKAKLDTELLTQKTVMSKQKAEKESETSIYVSEQQLKREEGEAQLEEGRTKLRLAQIEKEQALRLAQMNEEAKTNSERQIFAAQTELKRQEGDAELEEARQKLKLAQIEKDQQLKIAQFDSVQALALRQFQDKKTIQDLELQQRLTVKAAEADQAMKLAQAQYEVEKDLTPANLQMAALNSTTEVYSKMPLKEVKLVSLAGGGTEAGLGALLPNLSQALGTTSGL